MKTNSKRLLLLLVAYCAGIGMSGAAAAADALNKAKPSGPTATPLEFVTEENPPLNFTRNGELTGTGTLVIREMLKQAGMEAKFTVLPWTEAFSRARLERNTCVYSTAQNAERQKQFQWVGPVARGIYSVFALADFPDKIDRADQLENYRIGVVADARAKYLKDRGIDRLLETTDDGSLPGHLTLDRNQGGAIDLWMTQEYGATSKAAAVGVKVKPVFRGILSQDYYLACNKMLPKDAINKLNSAIFQMSKGDQYIQLANPELLPP